MSIIAQPPFAKHGISVAVTRMVIITMWGRIIALQVNGPEFFVAMAFCVPVYQMQINILHQIDLLRGGMSLLVGFVILMNWCFLSTDYVQLRYILLSMALLVTDRQLSKWGANAWL
jgi:hypothetical protein